MNQTGLRDTFGRRITYLRLSVTDRCNLRCNYCMDEGARFVPHDRVLSLEEIVQAAAAFTRLGVRRIRVTGGEPLVRRGIDRLLVQLGALEGLEELTLTTNGVLLERSLPAIREAGVRRINISLDSLRPERFRAIVRRDHLAEVLAGIDASVDAGIERVRINTVVQKGVNDDELPDLVAYAVERGIDIAFIEYMPLGPAGDNPFVTNQKVRSELRARFGLLPSTRATAGPATYYAVPGSRTHVGFISPMSHNFCGQCNRVRLTAEGQLYPCLDGPESVDLRAALRHPDGDPAHVGQAIRAAMTIKPQGHTFGTAERAEPIRFMNHTGG